MLQRTLAILMMVGFTAGLASASPQTDKMKDCNKQATGKKGDERKAFMKTCLSAKAEPTAVVPEATPAAAPAASPAEKASPQQRMKDCNEQAKGKKGDERKSFMSTCLKG